ncbi:hypothetical protein Tco_1263285 [Tanacetum coccineum]
MTKMFELLKELTTSWAPEKVLIRKEDRHTVTKNINSISLIKGEGENNVNNNATFGNSIERPDGSDVEVLINKFEKENKAENRTKNKPIKSAEKEPTQVKEEESVEAPSSQPVGPYILGTPFLTTAKAVIKFDKGTVTLRSGKSKMSFHRILESLSLGWHLEEIHSVETASNFKRWSQDFQSDDVIDLTMVSGRSLLKVALERLHMATASRIQYDTVAPFFLYIQNRFMVSKRTKSDTAYAASGEVLRRICPYVSSDERDCKVDIQVTRARRLCSFASEASSQKAVVDHFPTSTEVVRVETLTDEQLTKKVSALHCVMISHADALLPDL